MVPPDGVRRAVVGVQRQSQRCPRVGLGRLHAVVELNARDVLVAIERRPQRRHRLAAQMIARPHVIPAYIYNVTTRLDRPF